MDKNPDTTPDREKYDFRTTLNKWADGRGVEISFIYQGRGIVVNFNDITYDAAMMLLQIINLSIVRISGFDP